MRRALLGIVAAVLVACGGTERDPAPERPDILPPIAGMPGARNWADAPPPDLQTRITEIAAQRRASGTTRVTALAMSGGADNGAFGAGILNAWTERGDRPEFTVVTGVSTGALTAPLAFLGPRYDGDLEELYGGIPTSEIVRRRSVFNILPSASVVDTVPLKAIIDGFVTDAFLAEIAAEHARGRRLFVQTTHMDAQRPVIWDMGAIAQSGAPGARDLFSDVLLASASVPVAFPPVLLRFEGREGPVSEMHADGGVVSQVTVAAGWQGAIHALSGDREDPLDLDELYIIFNGLIDPEPAEVEPRIADIAARALDTMSKGQRRADLAVSYEAARERGAAFYATAIERDFPLSYFGPFDPEYMIPLYEYGYDRTCRGEIWTLRP